MLSTKILRRMSQLVMVGLVAWLGIQHQVVGGGPRGSAPIDSYCPFGGIETAFAYFTTGEFLSKTNYSNLVLLLAVVLLAFVAGGAFCGWLCPFGAVQEWLFKLRKLVIKKEFRPSPAVHKGLSYLRYVVLVAVIYFTVIGGELVFQDYDPFKVMFHFNFETTLAMGIFVATIIISLLFERAWCKYLCPLGALFSIVGWISPLKIRRNSALCINCNLCTKNCQNNIQVAQLDIISTGDCSKCLDCIDVCPKEGALKLTGGVQ